MAVMEVFAAGTWEMLNRPCVTCGVRTGNFCVHCLARDRLPRDTWYDTQRTPLCDLCDERYRCCRFCWAERALTRRQARPSAPGSSPGPTTGRAAPTAVPRVGAGSPTRAPRRPATCQGCMVGFTPIFPHKCPCKMARYCSTVCQLLHWPVHKLTCTEVGWSRRWQQGGAVPRGAGMGITYRCELRGPGTTARGRSVGGATSSGEAVHRPVFGPPPPPGLIEELIREAAAATRAQARAAAAEGR